MRRSWLTPTGGPPRIHLLFTRSLCRPGVEPLVQLERALEAPIDVVQIREKEASASELVDLLGAVRVHIAERSTGLVLNDRPDIALAGGADGVHLGQDDTPPALARELAGARLVIGLSTHDEVQARAAGEDPNVDYIGIGPLFPTRTKGYERGIGPELALRMQSLAGKPAFWIGGITPANAMQLRGAFGFAVSSAVLGAEDPARVVRELRERGSG